MHKRKILLSDGRYMIFYTFDESLPGPADGKEGGGSPRRVQERAGTAGENPEVKERNRE
jgi:hypothetical protein